MMKRLLPLLLVLAAVFAVAQVGTVSVPEYPAFLLRYPSVQADLRLSGSRASKIGAIQKEQQAHYLALIRPAPGGKPAAKSTYDEIQAQNRKYEASAVAVLSASQKKRLAEIGVQYAGGYGLASPSMAKKLGLSKPQIAKVHGAVMDAIRKFNSEAGSAIAPGKGGFASRAADPNATMHRLVDLRIKALKTLDQKLGAILTPAQSAKWKAMKGKPIDLAPLFYPIVRGHSVS